MKRKDNPTPTQVENRPGILIWYNGPNNQVACFTQSFYAILTKWYAPSNGPGGTPAIMPHTESGVRFTLKRQEGEGAVITSDDSSPNWYNDAATGQFGRYVGKGSDNEGGFPGREGWGFSWMFDAPEPDVAINRSPQVNGGWPLGLLMIKMVWYFETCVDLGNIYEPSGVVSWYAESTAFGPGAATQPKIDFDGPNPIRGISELRPNQAAHKK